MSSTALPPPYPPTSISGFPSPVKQISSCINKRQCNGLWVKLKIKAQRSKVNPIVPQEAKPNWDWKTASSPHRTTKTLSEPFRVGNAVPDGAVVESSTLNQQVGSSNPPKIEIWLKIA